MAADKRFYYECVYPCEIGFYGPNKRRETWRTKGRSEVQGFCLHNRRLMPAHGRTVRGRVAHEADIIVTDYPVGKSYVETVQKMVSRPASAYGNIGGLKPRVMRMKSNKIKLSLIDANDVTRDIMERAWDEGLPQWRYLDKEEIIQWQIEQRPLQLDPDNGKAREQMSGWAAVLFEDNDKSVELPKEMAQWAQAVSPGGEGVGAVGGG